MGRPGLLCSRRFYSIRVCAYLAVARRFMRLVLCWVVAPLICNLGYGGLSFDAGATRADERETRHPQDAIFTETIAVMSCLLFCCRVSWRVVPEPWGCPCNGRINWPCAFNSSGLFRVGCGPAALLSPRLWSGAGRRVCLFCARGSSHWPCSGCRGGILCKRCRGHCITVDGVRYCCCRLRIHIAQEETGQRFGYPRTSDPFDAGAFSPPCRLEKSSLFDCCSKGKRRRKLPGRRIRSHRRCEQRFTEHTGRRRLRVHASSWRCLRVRVIL